MSHRASAVQTGPTSTQSTTILKEPPFDSQSEVAQHPEWISKCREILISTETTNIASRVCHWRRIVNEKTAQTNERLNIFIPQNSVPKFEWNINNLSKYIHFVIQWNGLKMKQIKNSPANYEEYERKARNWLNGRRAPNYAGTLFPDMIKSSEQYADAVSKKLFGPNNQYSKAYQKILMFGYLHALCSVRISMNDVSKKTFLLCENSIKTNSVTSVLLQQYATDHPFAQYFPSHLKQAADYFQNKFEMDIKRFGNALRLAAGNNMSVNQVNPTMQSVQTTLTINGARIPSLRNNAINGITGLTINDLNNLHSINLSNYMHGIHGLRSLNDIQRTKFNLNNNANQPNSTKIDSKSEIEMNSDHHKTRDTTISSPVSLTNSNGTTSTTSIMTNNTMNSNPFNSGSSSSSTEINMNHMHQIPNLRMPPQITQLNANNNSVNNLLANAQINVNGKQQSVVSFLNTIVDTCNNQQIYMKNLQNRVHSMEQIIKQLQPHISGNNRNQFASLQPLPHVQAIDNQTLSSISSMMSNKRRSNSPQQQQQHLQFIIQPNHHHVQQIRSSSSSSSSSINRSLPNMAATPSHAVSKPLISTMLQNRNHHQSKTNIKLVNTAHVMSDESAAALLASLKHKMEPKIERCMNNKRARSRESDHYVVSNNNVNRNRNHNHNAPAAKKRKIIEKNI